MSAKKIVIGVAIIRAAGVGVYAARDWLHPTGAVAQSKAPERTVAVEVAKAKRKQVPVQIEALGTVTPMASVNIKPRLDTSIVSVDFADGAAVNKGDVLFRLDSRAMRPRSSRSRACSRATMPSSTMPAQRPSLHRACPEKRDAGHQSRQRQDPGARLRRGDQVGRSATRKPARATDLLHDRCADRGTHQHRERQGREFRALRRSGAARHAYPDRAGLCHVPGPAEQSA